MRKLKTSIKLIGLILILGSLWAIIYFLQFWSSSSNNNNRNYLPTHTQLVVRLDGNMAIKTVLSDLLSVKANDILEKFNETKEEELEDTGINFLSDILLFKQFKKSDTLTGVLLNISNRKKFQSFIGSTNYSLNNEGDVAIILLSNSFTPLPQSEKTQSLARKSLNGQHIDFNMLTLESKSKELSLVDVWTASSNSEKWSHVYLSVNKNKLSFTGSYQSTKVNKQHQHDALKSNTSDFHFTLNTIPKAVNDSLNQYFNLGTQRLSGISMNYRSLSLEQEPDFKLVPDLDVLLRFEQEVDIVNLLQRMDSLKQVKLFDENVVQFGQRKYHYSQHNSHSVYLGATPFLKSHILSSKNNLHIQGPTNCLSKIDGSSFLLRVLEIFPAYRASMNLSKNIDLIDVQTNQTKDSKHLIKGEVQFKPEKLATIEFIRFILEFRQ